MRWIFFVLVSANILLFGWHFLAGKNDVVPQGMEIQHPSDVPPIYMLGEPLKRQANEKIVKADKPASRAKETIDGLKAPSKPLCTLVGPFETSDEAAQLVERLAAMDVEGHVANLEIPSGLGYWVYLAPRESRREALRSLAELQARGVDSFIIPKGKLMNGISLGMFSQETLAHAHVRDMAELGLDAKIDIVERSYNETWVSVPQASASKLGEQAWQRLLKSNKTADRRQNFCLHVASQGNFH